jgi:hypothetical protein
MVYFERQFILPFVILTIIVQGKVINRTFNFNFKIHQKLNGINIQTEIIHVFTY